jgi:3-phenylpropionate/trans-cinnamate dioxygenase ferredoxin reductase component
MEPNNAGRFAPRRVVVVGAGLAGLGTVERLRHRGYAGELILLGAERHLPYDRPPLSKQVLRGERDDTGLRTANEFAELAVAVRLNLADREVETPGGSLAYDLLVIATGAVPRRIELGGTALRTIEDALTLRGALSTARQLTVVGAGLIGCEVAASARTLGAEVDVVDVLAGPAVRVLGPTVAQLLACLHADHGVRCHLGTGVARSRADRLVLDDGTELPGQLVLEAVGAVPDTKWLDGSGLTVANGVVCDPSGCAGHGVYAVGDVARWGSVRHEHWTNVARQADVVAAAILGQDLPQPQLPYWWSDQYDVKLQGLGLPTVDDDVELIRWGPKARTIAIYSRCHRVTGVVGFSAAAGVMKLRDDIAAGTDVIEVLGRLTG